MASLVVLACPPGPLTAVGDALMDWSATDLLHPFLLVETSVWNQGAPARGHTPGLLVAGGRAVGTSVEHLLTTQRFDRVRLVVLVPALAGSEGIPSDTEHSIHQAILGTSAVGAVELLRVVVTRPDSGPVAADLAREGWHNLIIAPEESRGPGLGHTVLPASTDPIEVAPDVAACLAGVSGMWKDLDGAPLDGLQAPFGRTLRLVRSWYRNLDASAVADEVRAGLLALDDGVPLPRQHGTQAVYIDDNRRAADEMASNVLNRNAGMLIGERIPPVAVEAKKIAVWDAIKMFFGFLGASLRNAPERWYSLVFGDVASAVAAKVQQATFGADPSQYAVVADGHLSGGASDWREYTAAAGQLDQHLHQSGPRPHEIAGNFGAIWQDYVDSGLTLIDAGERGRTIPIQVGTERGVLRRISDCVPSPSEAFQVPPLLQSAVGGITDVRAADPIGQHTLTQRLIRLSSQPNLARTAETVRRDLESWQQQTRHSYAAHTGEKLARVFLNTSDEVMSLMRKHRTDGEVELSGVARARQRAIAAWMRGILFTLLGVMLVLGVSLGVGILTWWGALIGAVVGVLVWLGGSGVLFALGQREMFRDLNARRAAMSQAEADAANLRTAVRDLHRQGEAYGQFLEWTRVLGAFLHAPFGDTAVAGGDSGVIAEGLPLNTRVGRAEVNPDATAEVVAMMRRDVYHAGWLTIPWQATLHNAGARLGNRAQDLNADPRLMFGQRAKVSESYLTPWADILERDGVGTASGEQHWREALKRLGQPDYRSRLVSQVIVPSTSGQSVAMSEQEFMAGVGDPSSQGKFDSGVLAREARLEGRDDVVQAWPLESQQGLDRKAVLVQLGDGLPDYTFDLGEVTTRSTEESPVGLAPPDPFGQVPADPAGHRPVIPNPPVSAPDSDWVF